MATCPVCGKICKSSLGLDGHIRLKNDMSHAQYRGYPTASRTRKVKHVVPSVSDDNRLHEMEKEIILLKQQLQQQPTEPTVEPSTKDVLVGDVEKIVHHVIDGLVQPAEPEQPVVQPQPLLEQLKQKMDGWPVHDYAIVDGAPEDLRDELLQHHISLIG